VLGKMRPNKSAPWTLRADSPITKQVAVRIDSRDSAHVLWAPRDRTPLDEYATLHSVGRDANGALVIWTTVADPLALLDALPLRAEEKQRIETTAERLVSLRRSRPITCQEFVARAVLGLCLDSLNESTAGIEFLTSMAELATPIVDDDARGPCAASCDVLASSVTSVPRGLCLPSTLAVASVCLLPRSSLASTLSSPCSCMLSLQDSDDSAADAAWNSLEVQFDLARQGDLTQEIPLS
jgi:hypothetical protein